MSGAPVNHTTEDELCEEWFSKIVSRDQIERFYVALIFRTEIFAQVKLSELVDVTKTQKSNAHVMVFNYPSYGLGNFYSMALKLFFNLSIN